MPTVLWQGLTLSAIGISLTFAGLGLLILTTVLLERLFRARQAAVPRREEGNGESSGLVRSAEDEEVVAAIAVALAQLRAADTHRGGLGATLESGPSRWWTGGRAPQASGLSPADNRRR